MGKGLDILACYLDKKIISWAIWSFKVASIEEKKDSPGYYNKLRST